MNTQNYIDYPKTHPLKHVNQTDPQRVRHRHRNRILIQLEEVYSSALENGSYPSALKAVALNIKMLTLMESPKAAIGLSDLNTDSLGKLLQDIDDEYGDLSPTRAFPEFAKSPEQDSSPNLERKPTHRYNEEWQEEVPPLPEETSIEEYESQKYSEQPEERKIKEPSQFQSQTPPAFAEKSPFPNLSSLDENTIDNKIAEFNQMEAAYSSPQPQSQNLPQSGGNSAFSSLASLGTEGIKRLIKEIDEQLGEDSPLRTIPEFAVHREEICGVKKENTQPKFQSGQELKNKPG